LYSPSNACGSLVPVAGSLLSSLVECRGR